MSGHHLLPISSKKSTEHSTVTLEGLPYLLHRRIAYPQPKSPKTPSAQPIGKTHVSKNTLPKRLLSWGDLPTWAQDNEYIHTGFRPISNSYSKSLHQGLTSLHNETGNIYTHLFATIWMLGLGIWYHGYCKTNYPQANADDFTVFLFFFLGGSTCFALSTTCHIFSNHSQRVHEYTHKLDFVGITAVIVGTLPPGLWYTFPCAGRVQKVSWISVNTAAQFIAAMFLLFVSAFRTPRFRAIRGFLFSFLASSAFYPIFVSIYLDGWSKANKEYAAERYILAIIIYVSSVTIFATRIPEVWKPGKFDIWFNSHQIFHTGMAVGLTVHFFAFAKAVDQFYVLKGGKC